MSSRFEIINFVFAPEVLLPFAVTLFLYWMWTRRRFYIFCLNFPTWWGFPIVGTLPQIKHINNVFPMITKTFETRKSNTVCSWTGLYPILLTQDIDFIDFILTKREYLDKAEQLYKPTLNAFRGGLIANKAKKWQYIRPLLEPCFNTRTLVSLFLIFNKSKSALISKMQQLVDGKKHDLKSVVDETISALTMQTTMGHRMVVDESVPSSFAKNFKIMLNGSIIKIFAGLLNMQYLVSFYDYRATKAVHKFVHELIRDYIAEKNNGDETEVSSNIFIKQAIKLYENNQLSLQDVVAESNTMVGASFETTANAIYSAIVMMAMFPDIQKKVYEELQSVFPDPTCDISYEDICKLSYLDIVLKEVLRVVPPVALIGRHIRQDTKFKDWPAIIPANIQVIISIFHLHRRADIWGPDAAEFKPSRFLEENLTKEQRSAYMPFSKGVRNCIGFRYAQLSLKVFVAGILLNFEFETDFKFEDLRFCDHIAMKYIVHPHFTLKRRKF